jgi:hypothetical protein
LNTRYFIRVLTNGQRGDRTEYQSKQEMDAEFSQMQETYKTKQVETRDLNVEGLLYHMQIAKGGIWQDNKIEIECAETTKTKEYHMA